MSKELLEAASNGEIDKVKKLLDEKDININFVNEDGDTALCKAIINGHENIASFLVEKNADVNVQNNLGCTALHYAIHLGCPSLFELIMTKKPDFTLKAIINENLGKTHTALCYIFENICFISGKIKFYRFKSNLTQEQHEYLAKCSTDMKIFEKMAQQLITAGAEINKISQVYNKCPHEFSMDETSIKVSTAFSLAIRYESIQLATILPGNVNEKTENPYTYLQRALLNKNISMACFLVEKGANLNSNNAGAYSTPLRMAIALNGSERLVQLFIEKGADVNQVMECRTTPLYEAVLAGNIQVAKLLIEKGAEITDKAKEKALKNVGAFRLIVESAIKNRSEKVSEQEILHQFFNKILKLYNGKPDLGLHSYYERLHIKTLMFYLLDCGLEMSFTIHDYIDSDNKCKHPAYDAHQEVLRLFENNRYNQSKVFLQRDDINSEIKYIFDNFTINGKVVCLNYRRKEDGNTWLHVAINHNPNRAAALILLGSRLDIPNNRNETVAQLIRTMPCFLILVKYKLLKDWAEERNARAKKNTTETNKVALAICPPSTCLVDVKMEKDRPITNQYNMSKATAATGTAASSGTVASSDHIFSSSPNAKEEVEEAFYIKELNETHNVKTMIKQIYDDIDKVQSRGKYYLASLLDELIKKYPDFFNNFSHGPVASLSAATSSSGSTGSAGKPSTV